MMIRKLFYLLLAVTCILGTLDVVAIANNVEKFYTPFDKQELKEMTQLGQDAAHFLGCNWKVRAETVESLNGWNGRVFGVSLTFSNDSIKVEGAPATFRIVRTSWDQHECISGSNPDADKAFSASLDHYWYYSRGTFGKAYPQEFEKILEKLHDCFELPRANSGVVCLFSLRSPSISRIDDHISFCADLVRLPGTPPFLFRLVSTAEHLIVTGPSGERLLPKKQNDKYSDHVGAQPVSIHIELWRDFDISKPGIYKIKMCCPFGEDNSQIAESREINLKIMPRDFFTLKFKRLSEDKLIAEGDKTPLELEFDINGSGKEKLSEIALDYYISVYDDSMSLFSGPFARWEKSARNMLQSSGQGHYRTQFDLADIRWVSLISSSLIPDTSFWKVAKDGKKHQVWVNLSGKIDGRYFSLSSDKLTFQAAQ